MVDFQPLQNASRAGVTLVAVALSLLLATPAHAAPTPGNQQPPGTEGLTTMLGIATSAYTAVSVSRGIATLIYGGRKKLKSVAI